jgi:putative transposase
MRELEITLETHRHLYNMCLEQRKAVYEISGKSVSYTEQPGWFKSERRVNPWFAKLNFSSAQATMRRLDKTFRAFFQRIKTGKTPGYPRFKSRDRFNSFAYSCIGDGARVIGNKLRLQHIGLVRINLHRPIGGKQKAITVRQEAGKWYIIVCCELPNATGAPSILPATGIDVGLERFLTAHDGYFEPPLQPLKPLLPKLRVEQRSLARKKRDSGCRKRQRRRVARLYMRITNTRRDRHHKIAVQLLKRYGALAVESLDINEMMRNHRLARVIQDAGWRQFLEILMHHAESAGVEFFKVDARGTSQLCSACGRTVPKTLSQRWHRCECGYEAHRDQNAARNILARGLLAGMQPGSLNVDAVMSHGFRSRPL